MTSEDIIERGDRGLDIDTLVQLGIAVGGVKEKHELLYSILPDGYKIGTFDTGKRNEELDERRTVRDTGRPLRNTGTIDVADVESFVLMVGRENIPETTIVTANMDRRQFTAIVNFAEDGQKAGHGDRKISLEMQTTLEHDRWTKNNRARMTQLQLADFLEENLENITEPPAAEMIEMISNLKVKRNAVYHAVIETETGEQSLSFSETIKGETQNGSFDFKSKFKIAITPFRGSKPYEITCNLRFSVDDQSLRIFFSMVNISKVVEHAFEEENRKMRGEMSTLDVPVINIA